MSWPIQRFTDEELAELAVYDARIDAGLSVRIPQTTNKTSGGTQSRRRKRKYIPGSRKDYYKANREKLIAYQKEYYKAHNEERAAYREVYSAPNKKAAPEAATSETAKK